MKKSYEPIPLGRSTENIIHDTPLITKPPRPSKDRVPSFMHGIYTGDVVVTEMKKAKTIRARRKLHNSCLCFWDLTCSQQRHISLFQGHQSLRSLHVQLVHGHCGRSRLTLHWSSSIACKLFYIVVARFLIFDADLPERMQTHDIGFLLFQCIACFESTCLIVLGVLRPPKPTIAKHASWRMINQLPATLLMVKQYMPFLLRCMSTRWRSTIGCMFSMSFACSYIHKTVLNLVLYHPWILRSVYMNFLRV